MNTGSILAGHPSVGSWVTYGLGSENENLPGFIVFTDYRGGPINGAPNWGNGYMPAAYQGTPFRDSGDPIVDLHPPKGRTPEQQQKWLRLLRELNEKHLDHNPADSELSARIHSYELAFRMQTHATDAIDISKESAATQKLYGVGEQPTDYFGRQALMARRLVERGVRFVQIFSGGGNFEPSWDAHWDLKGNHGQHCAETDKPIAGLIKDLKSRAIPTAEAQRGIYTYIVSGTTNQTRTAKVLDLAAARGLRTTLDPVSQAILRINNDIPKYSRQIADTALNRDTFTFNSENNLNAQFPTTRVDYFITPKQQATFSWNYRHSFQPGARRLPNPDIQRTNPFRLGYFVYAAALQSTFTPNTYNEFRYGVQHSGDTNTRDEYGPYFQFNNKPLRIGATLPFGPLVPFIDQQNVTGRHFITTMYDTFTLNRGQHTFTFGGSYRHTVWNDVSLVYQVPTYATGSPAGDPLQVANAFTTTTLPGIINTELGNPLALYNLLTGRVASSSFTRVVNPETFRYDGVQEQNFNWTNSKMGGFYAQDRWRISRSLTLNYGLRWEIQGPLQDGKGLAASPDLASI
jgi:hypothetical protein